MFQLLYADLRGSGVPISQRFCVGKKGRWFGRWFPPQGGPINGVTWGPPLETAQKNGATGFFFSPRRWSYGPLHITGFWAHLPQKCFFSSFCLVTEKSGSRNDPPSG